MDCRDIRDTLVRGQIPSGPGVDAHLASCEACSALLADHAALGRGLAEAAGSDGPALDLESLLAEVEQSVGRERGPVAWLRSRPTGKRTALVLVAVAVVVLFILAFKLRPDLAEYPMLAMLVAVALEGLIIGAAVRIELRPVQDAAPPAWMRPLLGMLALAVPTLVALLPLAHAGAPLAYAPPGKSFVQLALGCFSFGTALAAPVLLLLWALDRQGHRARGLAVLAAATGGVVGNLVLLLHCPITDIGHMLLGHASIGFVLVLLYAVLFRRRSATLDA